jgi:catechol 2,3-dioxygenase-like lactoylglutathione lyase family enzyme
VEIEVVPILRVADADAAVRWYERLGFTKQWEYRFDPGCPAFVSIACGGARLFCPSTEVMPGLTPWSACT